MAPSLFGGTALAQRRLRKEIRAQQCPEPRAARCEHRQRESLFGLSRGGGFGSLSPEPGVVQLPRNRPRLVALRMSRAKITAEPLNLRALRLGAEALTSRQRRRDSALLNPSAPVTKTLSGPRSTLGSRSVGKRLTVRTSLVTSQGAALMRFRRALDRGNVTEALSAASELERVGLAEAARTVSAPT